MAWLGLPDIVSFTDHHLMRCHLPLCCRTGRQMVCARHGTPWDPPLSPPPSPHPPPSLSLPHKTPPSHLTRPHPHTSREPPLMGTHPHTHRTPPSHPLDPTLACHGTQQTTRGALRTLHHPHTRREPHPQTPWDTPPRSSGDVVTGHERRRLPRLLLVCSRGPATPGDPTGHHPRAPCGCGSKVRCSIAPRTP